MSDPRSRTDFFPHYDVLLDRKRAEARENTRIETPSTIVEVEALSALLDCLIELQEQNVDILIDCDHEVYSSVDDARETVQGMYTYLSKNVFDSFERFLDVFFLRDTQN